MTAVTQDTRLDVTASTDHMTASGQSRKESANPRPSASNRSLRIGAWNVQTMYETGKCSQVVGEMERYNLHMLGLSEVRWPGHGEKRLQSGYTMYYSGREDNRKEEGVAIVLSKGYRRFCRGVEYHNERIISASFSTSNKNINLNLVQIYAPQNGLLTEQKEEFYRNLQEVVDKLPQKDVNIIMGDANAKIGADNSGFEVVMGKHGMGEMNENGEFFANFYNFNNLVIGGSIFPHNDIHKVRWE